MRQARYLTAVLGNQVEIKVRADDGVLAAIRFSEYFTPWIDNETVAKAATAIAVLATLSRREYEAAVFNSSRT